MCKISVPEFIVVDFSDKNKSFPLSSIISSDNWIWELSELEILTSKLIKDSPEFNSTKFVNVLGLPSTSENWRFILSIFKTTLDIHSI